MGQHEGDGLSEHRAPVVGEHPGGSRVGVDLGVADGQAAGGEGAREDRSLDGVERAEHVLLDPVDVGVGSVGRPGDDGVAERDPSLEGHPRATGGGSGPAGTAPTGEDEVGGPVLGRGGVVHQRNRTRGV